MAFICGAVVNNPKSAVLPLDWNDDLLLSWGPDTTPAQKGALTKALNLAKDVGLTLSIKSERLSGYSLPITMDLELVYLLQTLAVKAGHGNSFLCEENTSFCNPQFTFVLKLLLQTKKL